jgi:hypothetical protein
MTSIVGADARNVLDVAGFQRKIRVRAMTKFHTKTVPVAMTWARK